MFTVLGLQQAITVSGHTVRGFRQVLHLSHARGERGTRDWSYQRKASWKRRDSSPIGSFDMIWSAEPSGSQWLAQDTGILAVVTVVDIPADMRAQ